MSRKPICGNAASGQVIAKIQLAPQSRIGHFATGNSGSAAIGIVNAVQSNRTPFASDILVAAALPAAIKKEK
jgi:hypothetical protein